MILKLVGFLAGLVILVGAAVAASYDEPWSPATEQAATAAVAALGENSALRVVSTVHEIVSETHALAGMTNEVASSAHEIKASVKDLEAAKHDLAAEETDLEVRVELPADVLFDFDKADIRTDAVNALAQLATVIRAYKGPVRLEGHTDGKGNDAYNQNLSERRAVSVMRWLIERERIPAARLTTQGFGKSRPIASNDTDAGRQRNRRVEVVIRKK